MTLYSNIIKSKLDINNNEEYIEKLKNLKNILINNENYLGGAYFRCRIKPGKDEVNGVIGIAWVVEGLCATYEVLKDYEILEFLDKVVNSISFNKERLLWERPVYPLSIKSSIDETFNHQLWLAYALIYYSKIKGEDLSVNIKSFFSKLESNLNIHKDGLIVHSLKNKSTIFEEVKSYLKSLKRITNSRIKGKTTRYKENGYHLFNIYAFARIKALGYSKLLEKSVKVNKAILYASKEELYNQLTSNNEKEDYYQIATPSLLKYNRYGFPYNVSGFEYFYFNDVFKLKNDELTQKYLKRQLEVYGYDLNSNIFINDKTQCEDDINLLLRVYELSFYFS